jgi:hypothetical protein
MWLRTFCSSLGERAKSPVAGSSRSATARGGRAHESIPHAVAALTRARRKSTVALYPAPTDERVEPGRKP